MTDCTACHAHATERALDNYLDHYSLRMPHPEYAGVSVYAPLTDAQEAELAQWVASLYSERDDYGWHNNH